MFILPNDQTRPKKPLKSIWRNSDVFPAILLPLIVLIFSIGLAVVYSPIIPILFRGEAVNETLEQALAIKRIAWSPEKSILEYLDEHPEEPVIFTNTQAEKWRAKKTWKPHYLKRVLSANGFVLQGAYIHQSPTFGPYFDASKPMNLPGIGEQITRVNQHATWDPTAEEFFSSISTTPGDSWHYYTANLEVFPEELIQDIQPWFDVLDLNPNAQHEQNMNIWIGQKGVSAACHYDGYDNVNVQIYGKKKWTLYEPTNHTNLYLYPFLHFHHAQTQVDVALSPATQPQFQLFEKAIKYEGYTMPGEALYLPAMWFHKVDTLETAINVNAWVKTPASGILAKMVTTLPEALSPQSAQLYLSYLLAQLKRNSEQWIRTFVYLPRYKPLIDTQQLPKNGGINNGIKSYCLSHSDTTDFEQQEEELNKLAKAHALQLRHLPRNTLDIWLGNHVEYVLAFSTRDPMLVAGILHTCYGVMERRIEK